MRVIAAPLYVRRIRITDATSLHITGAEKYIERRNILSGGSAAFKRILAYLTDDEISLDDARSFYSLVEEIGYEPFLKIEELKGLTGMVLTVERPDEVPWRLIDPLFKAVKPHLEEFRPQVQDLYRRFKSAKRSRKGLEDLTLQCWEQARSYGFAHHFTRDRNGSLVHIIEGKDIRAGVLIGLAMYLERHSALPQPPPLEACRRCGEAINPLIYRGRRYCSDRCRRLAAKSDRSRLLSLILTKSRRMMERGMLTEEERRAMLQEIGKKESLERIREIAERYGVDPRPAKPGRPRKGTPPAVHGGGAVRTGGRGPLISNISTARRHAGAAR